MSTGQEHWWIVGVIAWLQILGFAAFGGGFLYAFVLGPIWTWAKERKR